MSRSSIARLPRPGQRIVVVGTTGSGKTTMARALAEHLGVPYVELDALHWGPDWTPAAPDIFRARVAAALSGDAWVVDGNYSSVRDVIWPRADTLVFLDYPLRTILRRLIRRTAHRMITREELWNGNRERPIYLFQRDSIILWALQTYRRNRRQYLAVLHQGECSHLRAVHVRSPREADEWLRQVPAGYGGASESRRPY